MNTDLYISIFVRAVVFGTQNNAINNFQTSVINSIVINCINKLHDVVGKRHTVGPRLSGHQLSGYLYYPAMILQ